MGFQPGDIVQLSPEGRRQASISGLTPKSPIGRILSIEDEGHPGGPWYPIYFVNFDGYGVFVGEPLIERAGLLDHLAAEGA